jgi:hypothetical protein
MIKRLKALLLINIIIGNISLCLSIAPLATNGVTGFVMGYRRRGFITGRKI